MLLNSIIQFKSPKVIKKSCFDLNAQMHTHFTFLFPLFDPSKHLIRNTEVAGFVKKRVSFGCRESNPALNLTTSQQLHSHSSTGDLSNAQFLIMP